MNTMSVSFDPENNREYRKYREMGDEIRAALLQVMETARGGGQNDGKFCEYCGAPRA